MIPLYLRSEAFRLILSRTSRFPGPDGRHTADNLPEHMHPDDFNGLRDWVFAKQQTPIARDIDHCTYSAPWRVG